MRRWNNFAVILLLWVITACKPPDQEGAKKLKSFDFLIDWQAEPTYLGVYYAKHLGEFERLGLDVNIVQSWGANQAVAAVAAGRYKISTASGGATVLGYNEGEQIVSLGVLYPRISSVVYGLSSANVLKPSDLEGKRIGIYPGSITKNEFDAFVKVNHLDPKRIRIISISGSDLSLLLAHKIDGVLHYTEMGPVAAEVDSSVPVVGQAKDKVFQLLLADYGVRGYGLDIVTSRQSYQQDPKFLQEVADATVEGYRAGCADREAAVKAFTEEFPQKNPAYVRESWNRVCALIGPHPGMQSEQGWQETIDQYRDLGLLSQPVEAKSILP
jgi:NitT/TauT family transport system substrate-binding protein